MSDEISEKVVGIIAELAVLEPSDISLDDSLEDIGMDSLTLVEAIFAIEESFGVDVPFNANDPEASEFDISTVGSIVDAVRKLVDAKVGGAA